MNAMLTSITLDDLTLAYREHPAVHHLSGRFETGSLTAVVGPNGAGKSSLLAGLMGQMKPRSGRVDITAANAAKPCLKCEACA